MRSVSYLYRGCIVEPLLGEGDLARVRGHRDTGSLQARRPTYFVSFLSLQMNAIELPTAGEHSVVSMAQLGTKRKNNCERSS